MILKTLSAEAELGCTRRIFCAGDDQLGRVTSCLPAIAPSPLRFLDEHGQQLLDNGEVQQ